MPLMQIHIIMLYLNNRSLLKLLKVLLFSYMKPSLTLTLLFLFCLVNAQHADYAKQIVSTLSSAEYGGRGYVDDGNTLAAGFIREQFKEIGLKPLGKKYFQPFKVHVNTFPSRMELYVDNLKLEPGKDFLIDPASCAIEGVFDVYLIRKQDLLVKDSLDKVLKNCKGKIVVIDETGFASENKDELKRANDLIQLIRHGLEIKNAGTIVLTSDKLSWGIAGQQSSKPSFTVSGNTKINRYSTIKLVIDARLVEYETNNVIGYISGKSSDSLYLLLAHYDHLGKMGSHIYFPGANDNASGVAMLLNLARYFKSKPLKFPVVFIATTAEEMGIIGSRYFIDHPLIDLKKIKFLINFDLAGTGEEGIKVVNGTVHRNTFQQLESLNKQGNYLKSVEARGPACNSDHCMFHNIGVPCFYIYTLGGIQAYHDIYDRPETLPLTEFDDYCKLMIRFLENMQ